eukprot:m.240202 g.240202  ORF g.240202 m.240202 type:complete len:279 (-) comp14653_c0_seq1:2259-3095(-)
MTTIVLTCAVTVSVLCVVFGCVGGIPDAVIGSFMSSSENPFGDPGVYDLLVFAMGWNAQFCNDNPDDKECTFPSSSFQAQNFGLHGLWPQYNTTHSGHDWPQFCHKDDSSYWTKVASISSSIKDKFHSEWEQYAPGYLTGLEDHEWTKHGTCSMAAILKVPSNPGALAQLQESYFSAQLGLMKSNPTPSIISNAQQSGDPVKVNDVLEAFGGAGKLGINCEVQNGKVYLNQIELCYGVDTQGLPTKQISCPDNFLQSSYDNNCVLENYKELYVAQLKN